MHVPKGSRVQAVLRKLCAHPDPRLYLSLVNLTKLLQMDLDIPKIKVATREGVLARLSGANATRGQHLFFELTNGIGCAACHRIAGNGNDFAPDLSSIGLRAKPETIVESILAPSAAITEGYSQQQFLTEDGQSISGVVLRETASELTVFKTDRKQLTIPIRSIVERQKLKVSAMPDGYALFGNEQIADLTAYLLTLRHGAPIENKNASPGKSD